MSGTMVAVDGVVVPRSYKGSDEDLLRARALVSFIRGYLQNTGVSLELRPEIQRCLVTIPEWNGHTRLVLKWSWAMLAASHDEWLQELKLWTDIETRTSH